MECGCIYVDVGDHVEKLREDYIKSARKEHPCDECSGTVKEGDSYKRHNYVFDGNFFSHVFCNDCESLKQEFFCDGYEYGMIRERVSEHVGEMSGEISSDCILNLTPGAREFVLDEIQGVFNDLNDDDF